MDTSDQTAQILFEAGIRLEGRYDTGAVFRAVEPAQTAILNAWLASIDWDTDIVFNARDLRDKPPLQSHEQFLDALLWAHFESLAYDRRHTLWQDIDNALWALQQADESEVRAQARAEHAADIGLRITLPKLLELQVI